MAGYHKYVFDEDSRSFVGKFEEMYQSEDTEGYDSWHERDLRPLRKTIPYMILNQYNFDRVLEIGCGKGTFTQMLKKKNNRVTAIDISEAAINKAKRSLPDIDFRVLDVTNTDLLEFQGVDLVVVLGTFAYVESWPEILIDVQKITKYFFVGEYIPENPIGFVKTINHLVKEVSRHFKIITKVVLDEEHCFLFAEVEKNDARE